jgi:hypothetical protein
MTATGPMVDTKIVAAQAKAESADPAGPAVLGESSYDRVTSMLLAVILGAGISLAWLWLIYSTNQAYQARVTAPLEIVEVSGGGGGSLDGQMGGVETIQVAGGAESDRASNNEEDASEFEQPSVEATPAAMLDTVAEAGQNLAEVDIGAVMPTGGKIATGIRSSKIGNGAVGYGFGPGDGGVRREDRWTIVANPNQTAEEYARQLDFFGIELGVVSGKQMVYVSRFSQAVPTKRVGTGVGDNRFYALWRGQGRKGADVALLRKAGIEVGEGVIIQFFPPTVEANLAQLEVRYKGRQPAEIRRTQFRIMGQGDSYTFEVVAQEALR